MDLDLGLCINILWICKSKTDYLFIFDTKFMQEELSVHVIHVPCLEAQ